MYILGIETSCDETSAAILEAHDNKLHLKANIIASSLGLHEKTGGIIPEQAAREQIKYILPVIQEALKQADLSIDAIDTFAVTYGPGLIGSLLVGVETIKTLSFVLKKPIIPVNHMLGHIYANFIDQNDILFPAIALVVSGGHTDLLLLKNHGDYQLLGGTRDDAAGECFDKCARLIGYQYPGGPKIAAFAKKGNPKIFRLPRPMIGSNDYEFSFSGLKTAFLNTTKQHFPVLRTSQDKVGWQQIALEKQLSPEEKQTLYDLCASLEEAIVDVLVKKTLKAATEYNVQSILLSGGVAANQTLRETFEQKIKDQRLTAEIFVPQKSLCTDNAAMIAAAAYYSQPEADEPLAHARHMKPVPWQDITADPELYFD